MAISQQTIENFQWYINEVKRSLQNAEYYRKFLLNEGDDITSQEMESLAQDLININNKLQTIEASFVERAENSKTEEEKAEELRRTAQIKKLKAMYFEETGENLLLSDKDIVAEIRSEVKKIEAERKIYQAPIPNWESALADKASRKGWVENMRTKLAKISEKHNRKG